MAKKGSVTLFLALVLSLVLTLFCASLESVRMAAARTQILNSVDVGLYSLFGQYEKTLLKDYDLFFLDGSCGGGTLKLASVYDNMESYVKPILKQNGQKLTIEQGGFTGYRLATDENGEVFYQQAVQYMKDTLGSQGVQLLLNNIREKEEKVKNAEKEGKQIEEGNALESYETEMQAAAENSQAAWEEMQNANPGAEFSDGSQNTSSLPVLPSEPVQTVTNPIPIVEDIQKMGILDLVLPAGKNVSEGSVSKNTLVSGRSLQKGMPMIEEIKEDSSYSSKLLFQQYLVDKLGNYQNPGKGELAYQLEYLLFGKNDDISNLKKAAERLLMIREGVNLVHLLADGAKRAQAQALAAAIASAFLIPPASVVIEAALLICWSFGESILDVRELFAGGKVPIVKRSEDWQLSLSNLANLLGVLDSGGSNEDDGMSYEEYLQVFLFMQSKKENLKRGMDMIELSIRAKTQNETFRLDSCVEALEAAFTVKANGKKTYQVVKQYSYRQS